MKDGTLFRWGVFRGSGAGKLIGFIRAEPEKDTPHICFWTFRGNGNRGRFAETVYTAWWEYVQRHQYLKRNGAHCVMFKGFPRR